MSTIPAIMTLKIRDDYDKRRTQQFKKGDGVVVRGMQCVRILFTWFINPNLPFIQSMHNSSNGWIDLITDISVHTIYIDRRAYIHVHQCQKLRVHPSPGAHISEAGCTIFGSVRFYHYYILGGCMEKIPDAQF